MLAPLSLYVEIRCHIRSFLLFADMHSYSCSCIIVCWHALPFMLLYRCILTTHYMYHSCSYVIELCALSQWQLWFDSRKSKTVEVTSICFTWGTFKQVRKSKEREKYIYLPFVKHIRLSWVVFSFLTSNRSCHRGPGWPCTISHAPISLHYGYALTFLLLYHCMLQGLSFKVL